MSGVEAQRSAKTEPERIGRYLLFDAIARGGMAQVHLARMVGPVGFSRIVAIKRLHPPLAREPEFVSMFMDEARLAARIRHPNVVPILDVVSLPKELLLVLEYVEGEALSELARAETGAGQRIPSDVGSAILVGVLTGLHAAHEAVSETGSPLCIVHRDVSPQNVMVCVDGLPRVLDFGIAHAAQRLTMTRVGETKGKPAYMAPEQFTGDTVDRRTDVYAAGVVAWEVFTGQRLFHADSDAHYFALVTQGAQRSPRDVVSALPPELDAVVMRAIATDPALRFQTAREFAVALERAVPPASQRGVAEWVQQVAGARLRDRARRVARIEAGDTALERESPAPVSAPGAVTAPATLHAVGETDLPPGGSWPDSATPTSVQASDELTDPVVTPVAGSPTTEALTEPAVDRSSGSLVTADLAAMRPPRDEGAQPKDRLWLALGGALLAVLFFIAVMLVVLAVGDRGQDPRAASPAPSVTSVAHAESAPKLPVVPPASANAAESSSAIPSSVPAPSAADDAAAGAMPSATPPTTTAPKSTAKPGGIKPPNPCDPPFTFNGRVKVPKPECF